MANFPTANADIINGNGGDDTIDALGGNDIVRGGWGDDRLFGGADDDRLYGDGNDDLLVGNTGSDRIEGGDGDDLMVWNNGDGSDEMEGGDGYDTTLVNGSDTAGDEFTIAPGVGGIDFDRVNLVPFSLDISETEKLVVNGLGGDDEITGGVGLAGLIRLVLDGGDGDDDIFGGDGADSLYGGHGDDHLEGFRGNDRMIGGWGDDVMEWDNGDGSDLIEGGSGYDIVDVDGSVTDGDTFVIAADGNRVDFDRVNLVPFALDIGSSEKLVVKGLGGDDRITAGDGLDGLIALKLYGGDGTDRIRGGDGDDWISGGTGDDWLAGGEGRDVMTGGDGADVFVFDKGRDIITDFEDGVDTIVIKGYDWADEYSDIEARIVDFGGYVEIDFGRHELKIAGADASWFDPGDFHFI